MGCGGSANDAQHRPILGRGRRPRRRAEGNHRRARGLSPAWRNRRAKRKSARTEATRGRSESFEVESCPGRAGARAGVPVQQIPACRRRESPAGLPETLVEGRCPRSRVHAARDIASRRSPLHRAFPSIRPRRVTTRRVRGRVVGAVVLAAPARASLRRARGKRRAIAVSFEHRHKFERDQAIGASRPRPAGTRSRRGTAAGRAHAGTHATRRPKDRRHAP